ncbi:MAG: hypothetical protein H0V17_19705 [Deltaproteobacteria bacterium]|nr:hypothetical protein [Deltaproteobacteria bacterium]
MRTVGLFVVGLLGCGGFPDPNPTPPTAPEANDPAFDVDGDGWYVVGNPATPSQDTMELVVTPPGGQDFIDVWVADLPVVRLTLRPDGRFVGEVPLGSLGIGSYDMLLAVDGNATAFAKLPVHRSAPYYVLVTTDWDFADPGNTVLDYQDRMHVEHPDMRITHFIGPYTFTDPNITAARQQELVSWLVTQRDEQRDEIGLHIHPYCHFVESAGITCVTDQSTTMALDPSGYTIKVAAYDRQEFGTLLDHASMLFEQHGLNRPKTFRAGGWTANVDTLNALADKGFTADTSALNWARIEEWDGKELYRWNMENWGPIGDTSQPYFPSQTDVLTSEAPTMSLLEVPDNGVMIDYVTLPEMTGLFDANWNGEPLASPSVLMMGFHPAPQFSRAEGDRVDQFLDYSDLRNSSTHAGPVVYITLDELVAAYQ